MTPTEELTRALMDHLPDLFEAHLRHEDYNFERNCQRLANDLLLAIRRDTQLATEARLRDAYQKMHHIHEWIYDDEPGYYRCDCGESKRM